MKFKRILASTMALVMVASSLLVSPVKAGAADTTDNVDLADGLVAEYLFDNSFADNLDAEKSATPIGTDTTVIASDDVRGNVVNMAGGTVAVTANGTMFDKAMPSGLQMPASIIADNDYANGITISFWVKSTAANGFSSLMDISDQNGDYSWGHIELAAGPQLRYNGWGLSGIAGDDWFELGAWPADTTVWLGDGGWELFTLSVSSEVTTMYIDGEVSSTTTDATQCARLLAFIEELGKTGRTSFRLGVFQTPGNWDWNWDAYAGSIDDVRVWDRALSATEVEALMDVEADASVIPPEITEVEAEDTITTDGTGVAVEYVYNAPEAGTYIVSVTGAIDSYGTSAIHPMFGYEMQQYAYNGLLEISVVADADNKVYFKLFDEETQELAISIEKLDTTGMQEDPVELELDVETTAPISGDGSYWYTWTAEETGALILTIDTEACAELGWYIDVMINGDWVTTQSNSVNEDGIVEIEVAADDVVTLAVNTFDWVEGTVVFTATFPTEEGTTAVEVEAEDTITTDGTGAIIEYVYNAPEAGTYIVSVTGAIDSFGTSAIHPMFGYEMQQYAYNGLLEISVVADADNKVYFKLFDEETQELAISIEKLDTTGMQEDPVELELDVETTAPISGDGSYWYTWTAEETGALILTIDTEACAELGWYMDVMINGDWVTTQSSSVNTDGIVEINVAAEDVVTIAVNTFDWVEGTVTFTATVGEGSGDDVVVGTESNPAEMIIGTNTAPVAENDVYWFEYVATENGTLILTMNTSDCTAGWYYEGYLNDYDYSQFPANPNNLFGGCSSNDADPSTLRSVLVKEGDVVMFMVKTSAADFTSPAGNVSFEALFVEGEGRVEGKEEFITSDTVLVLGDNNVTLDPSAETTGFEFTPEEVGTYKFEVTGDLLLGDWNSAFFPLDMTVNKTNTLEATITSVGQSILVGVTGEGDCTIKVTKVEGTVTPQEPTKTEIMYENKVTPFEFELPIDAELVDVNVTDGKVETAVLGADGFYHLNSADGPILFVNIGYYAPYAKLMEAVGYGQVKVTVANEDGSYTVTDYTDAINEYYASGDNGLCVLTEDLIHIYKVLGEDKGWYDPETTLGFYLFTEEVVDPETEEVSYNNIPCDENAWMFACSYVEAPAVDAEVEGVTGEDSEWTQGSKADVVITLDADIETFKGLYIDGKEVDPANYTVEAGSIIITLKAAYLDTLALGEHTVAVVYNNATVTNLDLTVVKAAADDTENKDTENKDTEDKDSEDDKKEEIDKKGDVSNMAGYMVVLMGVALVVVALVAKKRLA